MLSMLPTIRVSNSQNAERALRYLPDDIRKQAVRILLQNDQNFNVWFFGYLSSLECLIEYLSPIQRASIGIPFLNRRYMRVPKGFNEEGKDFLLKQFKDMKIKYMEEAEVERKRLSAMQTFATIVNRKNDAAHAEIERRRIEAERAAAEAHARGEDAEAARARVLQQAGTGAGDRAI